MSAFMILTPSETGKGYAVVAGYPKEKHRDVVLDLMRKNQPGKTFLKQNPDDRDREDGKKTL